MIGRYLIRELWAPLVAATLLLSTLFFVMAFLRGSELLLGSAVTPFDFAKFTLSLVPSFLVQTIPIATLLAVLVGIGRLADDGELAALFSVGLSPRAFVRGPLLLGLLLTGVMAVLTFSLKPWGIALMKATAQDIIRRNLVGDFKPGTFQEEVSGFTFYAESVDRGGAWKNVLLFDGRDAKSPLLALAPSCHIESDPSADWIGFSLEDGVLHRVAAETDEYTAMQFGRARFRADIGEAMFRKNSFRLGHDEYAPLELLAEAERAGQLGQPSAPFLAAFHWRVAQVFLPLAFALLATPLALVRRSGARGRSWGQALGLYVAFFVTARILVQMGEKDRLAPWVAGYLPLLICAVAGVALLWRAERRGLA